MSIVADILEELLSIKLNYKGIPVNIFGIPRFKEYYYGSVKSATNRLKKRGFIHKGDSGWSLTHKGIEYAKDRLRPTQKFESPFDNKAPKNLLMMFDIPQDKTVYRNWLRGQLREFDYIMVQKSVWVGPSPLPKEFVKFLDDLKIRGCIKTFKLAKGYNS